MTDDIVILGARRSPFGRYLGALAGHDPLALAETVARAASTQAGIGPEQLDRLFLGNCFATSFGTPSVVGRQLGLALGIAGFATTVDTACCSPLTALRQAVLAIRYGECSSALVAGVESMSRIPHLARNLRTGVRVGAVTLDDPIYPIEYKGYAPVAVDAEKGADRHGITREEMDSFALRSHQHWAAADQAGLFADEVVPTEVRRGRETILFARDEQPRPDTSLEKLAALRGVFGTRNITPGNAPGLNDGAAAVVVTTAARARKWGATPLATVRCNVGVTEAPDGIAWVPATAISAALKESGVALQDIQRIEINEAFAAMPLVSTRILADRHDVPWETLLERTNVNGGAVAIGHPVGASGLRILTTLIYELRRTGGGLGIAAICGGLSQGEATLVEV